MKRTTLLLGTALTITFCVGVILWPTRHPETPFSITLQRDLSKDGPMNEVSVVVSNSSTALLARRGGSLSVVSVFPGRMVTNFAGGSGFTEIALYEPGTSTPVAIASGIVPGAEKIRIEVDYHALSWRSKVALKLPNVWPLESVAGVFFAIDRFYGEERTWSEELSLIEDQRSATSDNVVSQQSTNHVAK